MKLTFKLLATLTAVAMLTACETAPKNDANANGYGAGSQYGADSGVKELAPGVADRVFFDYDSSVINAQGEATLQKQAEWMKKNSGITITVEGHCDERGTREYNLALGERRASAVKSYLTNLGVSSGRVHTISYGKERPAVTGSDESAYSVNRRGVTVPNN